MALEAVVFPQDPFGYISCRDFLFHDLYFQEEQDRDHQDTKNIKIGQQGLVSYNNSNSDNSNFNFQATEDHQWRDQYSLPSLEGFEPTMEHQPPPPPSAVDVGSTANGRRKRRKTRSSKNKEEIENQRMTHIAVERNRRKQMNEYLAVLRSLMPPSYAQRGDQASIIGGAINYVKELEHLLQSMEPQRKNQSKDDNDDDNNNSSCPFSDFFSFPQYSARSAAGGSTAAAEGTAEIEVTMVESHANLKILSKKRPRQLVKLVAGIQSLRLTLLHLNVTTLDQSVLYSISVKVEEGSQLNTVDEIAAAVNQILRRIEEESAFS